jgi:translation initiation factor IF-1
VSKLEEKNNLPEGGQEKGMVVETLPNTMFKIQIEGEEEPILAYLSGKMRMYRIRILTGDTVELILDPYGGKARIIKRL